MAARLRPSPLHDALAAVRETGRAAAIAGALDQTADVVRADFVRGVMDEIPAFSASGNPEIVPELERHTQDHIAEIRRLLAGGLAGDFDFVRRHARRRAEQRFPLEATLHSYRCGHKVLSRWMRDAVNAVVEDDVWQAVSAFSDFAIEYTDAISTVATAEYVAHTRQVAEEEGDRRVELLTVLLKGYDESDGRVSRLLRRSGYLDRRQSFCVAVAQSVEPKEMEHLARARRLSNAVSDSVRDQPVRSLVGIRDDTVVAVFSSARRTSGWTRPQTALARRVKPLLLKVGPAALVGISADAPSTSGIAKALDEARMALEFATVGDRVVLFADVPVRELVLRVARDDIRTALPAWVDDFLAADATAKGAFSATLRAYADADMNVLKAAARLAVHPNTIYSRFNRIADVTGLNALGYYPLTELLLAVDCRR